MGRLLIGKALLVKLAFASTYTFIAAASCTGVLTLRNHRAEHPMTMLPISIPKKQTVALVRELGGPVEFDSNYPVKLPGQDEVLAKVLYTGVCQSGTT